MSPYRRTLLLDSGVRFIEFDIHDNGYATAGDYGVCHDSPGDQVDHLGNPASNNLRPWLQTVAAWSAAHPEHAPLLVMLDIKDNLTSSRNAGKVVRGWDFDAASPATTPLASYPATDLPQTAWYADLLSAAAAVQ
ncbi:hypothetical protein AB0B31_14430 [Catellatospora citrea]|uniref:hypothetical protein n=1 Tax=Catellatospora citrea TaxID=53366 RepID=UPI0033FED7FF